MLLEVERESYKGINFKEALKVGKPLGRANKRKVVVGALNC